MTTPTKREGNDDGLLAGYGNHLESEAYPDALPIGRNNPRVSPRGLYTEQLSGTAFTAPRAENRRTWLYRIRPSACGTGHRFVPCGSGGGGSSADAAGPPSKKAKRDEDDDAEKYEGSASRSLPNFFGGVDWTTDMVLDPNPMRWGPSSAPVAATDEGGSKGGGVNFLQGVRTAAGSGDPTSKTGLGIYTYVFDADMTGAGSDLGAGSGDDLPDSHLYNSDGDFLFVPQQRGLFIRTELGALEVRPGEICILPRGVVFSVNMLPEEKCREGGDHETPSFARGYVLEIFRGHFTLPELGPIGSNGLANARDFLHPSASYESDPARASKPCVVVNKFGQRLFVRRHPTSPYDVVAWQGNYLPCKYDLARFCAVNSVTYDHPDPSIYTVLTARGGDEEGTALADFVVFPPRIMATDANTFRPPWFHRNVMTEYMGLIRGTYDAKSGGGFVPGASSLHPVMTPHGPDAASYRKAVANPCDTPAKFDGGLAFMFETSAVCKVSRYALECSERDMRYANCWDGFDATFPEPHAH